MALEHIVCWQGRRRHVVRLRHAVGSALLLLTASIATAAAPAPAPEKPKMGLAGEAVTLASLHKAAPDADPDILAMALEARACAQSSGQAVQAQRLAVIDYTRPSTQRRLWIFDLASGRLLFSEYVAHGRGSGDNFAAVFSNVDGSHASSLGLFETAETYVGGNGYSLRLDGLEPGFNDRARDRAIVMHGAWYVDPILAQRQGRLGRSYGCPAVRQAVARPVIDALKSGQLLFAYYPDATWLKSTRMLGCKNPLAMRSDARAKK